MYVKPKKGLGQHFLNDEDIAWRIVEALFKVLDNTKTETPMGVMEVGAGTGVLTKYLLKREDIDFKIAEIDTESVEYLLQKYPVLSSKLHEEDFLRMKLEKFFPGDFCIIGNFPYNISSQIFFKILDYKESIPYAGGMVQKEVAERLASDSGNKAYGILSVLLQAWYDIEYLFTVEPHVFTPPPKVRSAVIRIKRNDRKSLGCDEELFKKVVKTSFNQRRKTIRNSLKPLMNEYEIEDSPLLNLRPEQLSVEMFIELVSLLKKKQ